MEAFLGKRDSDSASSPGWAWGKRKYIANTVGGFRVETRARGGDRHSVLHGKVWWSHIGHTALQFLLLTGPFPLATTEAALIPVQNWSWNLQSLGPWITPDQIRDSAPLERALLLGQGGSWAKTPKLALEKIYITRQIKQSCLSPLMHVNMIWRSVSSCFPTRSPGSLHVKQRCGSNVYTSS